MKKLIGLVLGGIWVGLTLGIVGNIITPVHAQSVPPISPFVYTSSSSISTLNSSTVTIKGLGGLGTTCAQINNSGTLQNASGPCGTGGGGSSSTYSVIGGSGVTSTVAVGATNTTTTVTLNINNGSVQTCVSGQDSNGISALGIISCNIAVHTIAGVNTSTISFVAAGGTSIATTTNSITFTTVSTSTANTWTALQSYTQGVTVNGTTTLASTTSALLVTNASGVVSGFAGSNCSAGAAPTGHSATGTVQNCTTYLQGNQSVTLTISGDATGTASGATSINNSIQVTGLLGKALPSLATGTLEYTGGAWVLGALPLTSYNVSCVSGCSVSTTTTSAAITVTGGGGSNNATGTVNETAIFNATNTLISSKPEYVPSDFATNGCAGSSTATTINGCLNAMALRAQAAGYQADTIFITHDVVSSTYPAPINLNINGFPVQLECTAGTRLFYNGVTSSSQSGAIVFNFGNPIGHATIMEGAGCNFLGKPSLVAAGQTNTATTTGAYIGGGNGAVGIVLAANFNGFGKNYEVGQNAYMFNFIGTSSGGNGGVQTYTGNVASGTPTLSGLTNASNIPIGAYISGTSIPNNAQVIGTTSSTVTMNQNGTATSTGVTMTVNFGSLAQWDFANNSGERALAVGGTYTDPGNSSATNALYVANGAVADIHILQNAIDDAHIYCGTSDGLCDIEQNHEENSDYTHYGTYHLVTNPSSDLSTLIVYKGNEIANDTSGANSLGTLIVHGGQLQMSGNIINNYGGGTIPALADHSNDNGLEGESICGNTVSGGTLTNIVAGGGGNSYSQAAALGCSIDVGNSYTINIYPQSNNTNVIASGNSTEATFDHNGNWTFSNNGAAGSVTITGTLSATQTISQNGSAVALSGGAGVNGNCVKWTGANTIGDQGAVCGSGSGGSNGNLFVTPSSSVLSNNAVVYATNGSTTVRATSSVYSFTNGDTSLNSSTDQGLLSVTNASNTAVVVVASTTGNNFKFQVATGTQQVFGIASSGLMYVQGTSTVALGGSSLALDACTSTITNIPFVLATATDMVYTRPQTFINLAIFGIWTDITGVSAASTSLTTYVCDELAAGATPTSTKYNLQWSRNIGN